MQKPGLRAQPAGKNKEDLGMAYHTPPFKKAKKQGEMPLPKSVPIHLKMQNLEMDRT